MDATLQSFITGIQDLDSSNVKLTADLATATKTLSDTEASLSAAESQLQEITTELQVDDDAKAALTKQVADLQAQLALQRSSGPSALDALARASHFTGLHLLPRDPLDAEKVGAWKDAGGQKADSNPGTNTTPHGTASWVPFVPGVSTRFTFNAAGPWDNAYMFTRLPFPAVVPEYVVDVRSLQLTPGDVTGDNRVEWENQLIDAGAIHNMAWQAKGPQWRIFNYTETITANKWVSVTGIPMPDFTNPVIAIAEYQLDRVNKKTTHVALTLVTKDGTTRYPVGITFNCGQGAATTNKHTVAWQLDSEGQTMPPVCGVTILDTAIHYV